MPVPPMAMTWMSRVRSVAGSGVRACVEPKGRGGYTIATMTHRLDRSWPPRLFTAALALSLALFAPSSRGQQQPAPAAHTAPRAIAPEPIWDAGIVARGAKVAHEFAVRNHGVEMLQLREVRPSCGCTVVSYDAAVAPGGTGKV